MILREPDPVANPGEQRKATQQPKTSAGRVPVPSRIVQDMGDYFRVEGRSEEWWNVRLDEDEECYCKANLYGRRRYGPCVHVRAVREYIKRGQASE